MVDIENAFCVVVSMSSPPDTTNSPVEEQTGARAMENEHQRGIKDGETDLR